MGGLSPNTPIPTEIKLHQQSRYMEIAFDDGVRCELPYEYLLVFSPSAEVLGHCPGQEVPQVVQRHDVQRVRHRQRQHVRRLRAAGG